MLIGRPYWVFLSPLSKWPRFELWTVNVTWKMTVTIRPGVLVDIREKWDRGKTLLGDLPQTIYTDVSPNVDNFQTFIE